MFVLAVNAAQWQRAHSLNVAVLSPTPWNKLLVRFAPKLGFVRKRLETFNARGFIFCNTEPKASRFISTLQYLSLWSLKERA